jgi:acyl-coenzyme A thioesterase PaaI-like protein
MGNRVAVVNVLVTASGEPEPIAEGRAVFSIRRDVGVPDI